MRGEKCCVERFLVSRCRISKVRSKMRGAGGDRSKKLGDGRRDSKEITHDAPNSVMID